MNFSFCSIAFRNKKITFPEILSLLSKMGYQGIELWANHVNNGANLKEIKEQLQEYNLSVPMVSPYFDFTAGKQKWEQSIETAKHFVEIASFLETPLIRAFTGIVGSHEATSAQQEDCVRGLKEVCSIAKDSNISIALETHPSTLVDNVNSTLNIIAKVGAQNLKVNLDIYHMFEVHKDPLLALDSLYPHMAHVHAKNAIIKPEEREKAKHPLLHDPQPKADFVGIKSLAEGEMDYKPFINNLLQKNYGLYVSVEWFGTNPEEAALKDLKYLKELVRAPCPQLNKQAIVS
ncbi:MAG: sugar phosphate isomerase/epimerase [Actinobacteria bacterium]|nr:MAG: sugar phosphate isomerase/epimerase [Actinomycetota bacterium]